MWKDGILCHASSPIWTVCLEVSKEIVFKNVSRPDTQTPREASMVCDLSLLWGGVGERLAPPNAAEEVQYLNRILWGHYGDSKPQECQ